MIETLSFRTQARTIDHLGREQIADCPTAISELWKNSYDAYARRVGLHIFDGDEPVAAVLDDGHGMSRGEFVDRWLVVGTESKYDGQVADEKDRDGLPKRSKQGQKGIGRLSSANLGPLLLIISKRRECDFVAALIDWRIFENPFLVLSDIQIPVTEFSETGELSSQLPELFDSLTDNVWGGKKDPQRAQRLGQAWAAYDALRQETDPSSTKPSEEIVGTLINARFDERHFSKWRVWSGEATSGTAMFVSDINYDLRAQLPSIAPDGSTKNIRDTFFATLSAFTDPFVSAAANETNAFDPEFDYEVVTWTDGVPNPIIGRDLDRLTRDTTDDMEHVISGNIDADGIFRGQIKAFGEWRETGADYEIKPPADYKPPHGPKTFVGPFSIHLSTYERQRENSTHTDDQHARLNALADRYSGFLIYRNGLRILPYGRVDSDFFEIEQRRSINAGREFWNARRMFGRVALSREQNPNLRDKAGREGFIDNRAAKALRTIVVNILRTSARDYFGGESEARQTELQDIQDRNRKARAEHERKELAKRNRKRFRAQLKRNLPMVLELAEEMTAYRSELALQSEADIMRAQAAFTEFDERISALRVVGATSNLGTAEDDYRQFRQLYANMQSLLSEMVEVRKEALERIKPAKPEEIVTQHINQLAGQIHARTRRWKKEVDELQDTEKARIEALFSSRNKVFHEQSGPVLTQVENGLCDLHEALEKLSALRHAIDEENEGIFQSYIETLELLKANIDVELIARQGTAENSELRDELNKLNQVAQLGITVEILGHELHTNEQLIRTGLRQVRAAGSPAGTEQIELGFEGLSQQLEFLAPLKLSGTRVRRRITGEEIIDYLHAFFASVIRTRGINIEASDAFRAFSVDEQPSRLLPVFINLVNNSIYWLIHHETEGPLIRLDTIDGAIAVSDNGPGVDPLDQENLFRMFFTRKMSGGRGIGLYLCRMNLTVSGHSIRYASEKKFRLLPGANFIIDFKGAEFGQ
ncbi:ATPase [Halopseudomonas oceani]|uniref:Histidine kinase n=1 Tax=Halopseudomonas oceani TaxID=1708783 RepID=A0A2P4EQE9_9GAMM|nr:ATP-binding protein [Halopseudomonas oceani]POB00836.1 histidine kinase [Halopseudomonas oceani]GGE59270.1 ATPase [Halopseudomonas oceani]